MIKKIVILTLLVVAANLGFSQTYPVQVTTTIIPPYSVYLSDYVAVGSDRLALNVLLGDVNRPQLQVRFKLRIQGQGIIIETKPGYIPPPVILEGGIPERFTASDLVDYFKPENLNFQGISQRAFERTGALPEGLYQFCFEVIEYNRGVKISNSGCATAWLILNNPPIINLPKNGEKLRIQDPQYVTFQWTPRHTGSPNSAFATEYELSIVEIWPETRNPNDAILTSPPIFEATTPSTTLIYGPAETPLVPGRHYAFRVRAKSMVGIDELDLFKNNGYSEVFTFVYGEECKELEDVSAEVLAGGRASISWEPLDNHTAFSIRYRPASSDGAWEEQSTYLSDLELNSLQPGTTYNYQVAATCSNVNGPFTPIAQFTTPQRNLDEFACGTIEPTYDLSNTELIEELKPGDYIYAGDFDIQIDNVVGESGEFTGGGKAEIPFLHFVKVRAVFTDIKVNTDRRVIDGNVYTYWDPESSMFYDASTPPDAISEGDDGLANGGSGEEPDAIADSTTVDGEISQIYEDPDGNIIVVTTTGDTTSIPPNKNVVVTDSNGNSTIVGPDGTTSYNNDTGNGNSTGGGIIAGADFKLGPISFKLNEDLNSDSTTTDGFCIYNNIDASFILTLEGTGITKEVTINNASLSFKKKCDGDEYKDVQITYNATNLSLGKIGFIDATLTSVSLQIDSNGNLSGDVDMTASLASDQTIDNYIKIKQGVSGSFSFSFSNQNSYAGSFDFQGISNISLDLLKGGQTIASLNNGSFNGEGNFNGTIELSDDNSFQYSIAESTVIINSLKADVQYSIIDGLKVSSGEGLFTLSNIAGLQGELKLNLAITPEGYTTTVNTSTLSGYGMTFTDLDINAEIDNSFTVKAVSGKFKAKHSDFNTTLEVKEFNIQDGKLTSFNAQGQIIYNSLTINVLNSTYNADQQIISLSAEALVDNNGIKVGASIDSFTIDNAGNITLGDYQIEGSGDLTFGAVRVSLEGSATSTVAEGDWNSYEATGTVYVKLKGQKAQKEAELGAASLKFKQNASNGEFKDVDIAWTSEQGIDLGKIGVVGGRLKQAHIQVDEEGKIQGDMSMSAYLNDDVIIRDNFVIRKGLNGDFSFRYAGADDFDGIFSLEGVKGVNVDFVKSEEILASLKDGELNKEGVLSGKLVAAEGQSFTSKGFQLSVNKLEMDITYSSFTGIKVTSGEGSFKVDQIQGLNGDITIGLEINEDVYSSSITSNNIGGYGFTFSELNIEASFNNSLDLEKVSGSLKVKHDDFDAAISIKNFLLEDGTIKEFQGDGQISYQQLAVNISEINYSSEQSKLIIDANVEVDQGGMLIAASVNDFTIDLAGNINFGSFNANVSGRYTFGPVVVALTSEMNDLDGSGAYRHYEAEAALLMKFEQGNVKKEKNIGGALISFEKHRSHERYRNVKISIDGKNYSVGEVYGINAAIKSFDLEIDSDESYLTGAEGEAATISGSSRVVLTASLTEDKQLTSLIRLKKGVEGQIVFNFSGGNDFSGDFDLSSIKKLNVVIEKGDTEIAALKNIQVNSSKQITGKMTASNGMKYNSGAFEVTVEKLELDVTANLVQGWSSFAITNADGKFSIGNIKGVDGTFKLGMTYGVDNNFHTELLSEESEISAFGMELANLNLEADFNEMLDLTKISGSLSATHSAFDASIDIQKFEVEDGELTKWNGSGQVNYKSFLFEIIESSYLNDKLSISSKVEIANAGKLAVDRFQIDKDGNISIGKISGEFNSPMVIMKFNATFGESSFAGTFNGDVRLISFDGAIDIGKRDNYGYAYLSAAVGTKAGIPLGPTGLKLNKIGGRVGYNYFVTYSAGQFSGSPRYSNYLLGMTLGISDAANLFSAEGTTLVQFGGSELQLSLMGNIKAPRTNPIINSDFNVNYHLPDNTVDGSLRVDVQVPPSNGYVFKTDNPATFNFDYANNDWNVEGHVSGKIFNTVTFTGNTSLSKEGTSISGYLDGMASYTYTKKFEVHPFTLVTLGGDLNMNFSSSVHTSLSPQGIQGVMDVRLLGNATLYMVVSGVRGDISATINSMAELSYISNQGRLRGDVDLTVSAMGESFTHSVSVDKTF
ncbi:fibronectin type III domain-containing protein [Fulvivirga ligni]|uniref:fibronectin type III domain-containing protein n=1 Tax=Fulvivirga ligni TaxID=2904246 RepID=UPI001F190652|nr:fibronectin type III domain-containing protein [Fulvivirga ligni]UII20015.1 fibronectin type III domain-containing protein [Fulvivirga ligni]